MKNRKYNSIVELVVDADVPTDIRHNAIEFYNSKLLNVPYSESKALTDTVKYVNQQLNK